MTRLSLFLPLMIASLPWAAAGPQSLGDKPKTSVEKGKLEIELPSNPKRGSTPLTGEDTVAALLPDLRRFPDETSRVAIERLSLSGEAVVPPLRLLLTGQELEPRVAAAVALGQLRDQAALPAIERLLRDKRAEAYVGDLYESIESIDEQRALDVAVQNARGKSAPASAAAMRFLRQRSSAENAERFLGLLNSDRARVRQQAFQTLQQIEAVDLTDAALQLLGDSDSATSEMAFEYLQSRRSEEATAGLIELALEDPPSRQALWGVLTVAEIERRDDEVLLEPDHAALFEGRLRSLDPLVRLSSAFALTGMMLRSERDDAEIVLSGRVLPAIMETFLENNYFKDFRPLFRMSRSRVKQITGVDLGDDLIEWRRTWLGEGATTLLRRDLAADQLLESSSQVVVRLQLHGAGAEAADQAIAVAGEDRLREAGRLPNTLFATDEQMKSFLEELSAGGLLGRPEARLRDQRSGYRLIRLRLGNRERAIVAQPGDDPVFDRGEARLRRLAEQNSWQRLYLGERDGFVGFYEVEKQRFGAATPEEWDKSYLHLLQIALPTLSRADRVAALGVLLSRTSLLARLGPPELLNLLGGLESEPYPEGPVAVLVRVVVARDDVALRGPTLDFLTRRFGERASDLIGALLWDSQALTDAASHPSPEVRRVVMDRLPVAGVDASVLSRGLDDADARVKRAAILAMGRSDDPALLSRLLTMARSDREPLRNVALEALGSTTSVEALRVLDAIARETSGLTRRAALSGLAKLGGPQASVVLRDIAESEDIDPADRLAAVAALGRCGDGYAVEELVRQLGSSRQDLREEAACQLAGLGDTRAVPTLLELLQQPSRAPRAIDFLSVLMCCDGGPGGAEFKRRYEATPFLTQMDWFRRALEDGGYLMTGEQVQGVALGAVVKALQEGRWFLRYNSARLLEREFGTTFGTPYRFATAEEMNAIAARWVAYLSTRSLIGT